MLLEQTDDFIYILAVTIVTVGILATSARHVFRMLFRSFYSPSSLLLPTRRMYLDSTMAVLGLFAGYFVVVFVNILSGSSIASFVAAQLAKKPATTSEIELYVCASCMIGTMAASVARILPPRLSRSIVQGLYYQALCTVGGLILFWGPRRELSKAPILKPVLDTLRALLRTGFVGRASFLLLLVTVLTEVAVIYRMRSNTNSARTQS